MNPPAAVLLVSLCLPLPVGAQTQYYARVGAAVSSSLVRDDRLGEEITVRQSIGPSVTIGGSLPIAPHYRAALEATVTTGGYHSSAEGVELDLGNLTTGSLVADLTGPLVGRVSWRAGVGVLSYWPSEDSGIFQQGGSTRFLAGAGLDFLQPALRSWDLMVSLRYDYHRFTTDELETRGFSQTQAVSRVIASVGLARAIR